MSIFKIMGSVRCECRPRTAAAWKNLMIPAMVTADWRTLQRLYSWPKSSFGHQTAALHFPGNLVGNRPLYKTQPGRFRLNGAGLSPDSLRTSLSPFQRLAVFPEKWLCCSHGFGDHFAAVKFFRSRCGASLTTNPRASFIAGRTALFQRHRAAGYAPAPARTPPRCGRTSDARCVSDFSHRRYPDRRGGTYHGSRQRRHFTKSSPCVVAPSLVRSSINPRRPDSRRGA